MMRTMGNIHKNQLHRSYKSNECFTLWFYLILHSKITCSAPTGKITETTVKKPVLSISFEKLWYPVGINYWLSYNNYRWSFKKRSKRNSQSCRILQKNDRILMIAVEVGWKQKRTVAGQKGCPLSFRQQGKVVAFCAFSLMYNVQKIIDLWSKK